MNGTFVDMHIHSYFSDGSLSPQEIARAANENRVGLIALADHNVFEGSILLSEECKKYGIRCVPAVEIDSIERNNKYHILAYGFDSGDKDFMSFLSHTRFLLDEVSVKLIELMRCDYPSFSIPDYMDFSYDRKLGGWKALHYLREKGLTSSLNEGIRFYSQYGLTYDKSGYSTIPAIIYRIKKAGGFSVLAHPGELIDQTDIDAFESELRRIVAYGLDGIECYYPSHTAEATQVCLNLCRERDLLITAGSDCHGVFGKTRVGEMDITPDKLILKGL